MRKKYTIKKPSSIKKKNPIKPINWDNLNYLDKPANHVNLIKRKNKKKKNWQKIIWKKS